MSALPHDDAARPARAARASRPGPVAPPMDLDALITDPETRIVVCCGSGGVGKTTTSAALALAAEVTEHAKRWAGQDALRDEVEALGRPTVELPLLPGPMDVGTLFELADRIEDHLRSQVAA